MRFNRDLSYRTVHGLLTVGQLGKKRINGVIVVIARLIPEYSLIVLD